MTCCFLSPTSTVLLCSVDNRTSVTRLEEMLEAGRRGAQEVGKIVEDMMRERAMVLFMAREGKAEVELAKGEIVLK